MYDLIAKREGAYASLPVEKQQALVDVCKIIEEHDILKEVNTIFNVGVLTPITLNDDEFGEINDMGYKPNLRYPDIVKTGNGKILNTDAYNIFIRAKFNHDTKSQEEYEGKAFKVQPRIYISKGGIITGEYFNDCIIRQETIDEHNYKIRTIPIIPVSIINRKNETYFVVDHREPKVKAIKEMYEVPIYMDEKVKSMNMNLRKYKKLNKE